MAIVVVQVGQCGNQLGDELFTQLSLITKNGREAVSPFFTRDGKARCILVDSEPKVVQGVRARHADFIRPENAVCGQSGRGNNWGLGYYGVNDPHSHRHEKTEGGRAFKNLRKGQREADDSLLGSALRAIHMETRRTSDCGDGFEAVLLIHSLVGGTGSGMASRLAEKIRMYFVEPPEGAEVDEVLENKWMHRDGLDGMLVEKRRAKHFVSIAVAPQAVGELSTQGLNAALTLQVMMANVDAILLLRNDDAMMPGEERSSSTSAGSGKASLLQRCMTFKEANEVFVSLLLPIFHYGVKASGSITTLVQQCAPRGPSSFLSNKSGFALRGQPHRTTAGNIILTLLPTPQRVYTRFRESVNRGRFYALSGGKELMPGCAPEIPWSTILTSSAMDRGPQEATEGSPTSLPRLKGKKPCSPTVPTRRKPKRVHSRFSDSEGESEEDQSEMDQRMVLVPVPPHLHKYYQSLRDAPVASLYRSLEGVAVLNQARELNAALLFPLLLSAAVKVKTGAFLSTYQDVGVSGERIEKAYHEVAEVLSNAEAL